MRKTICVPLIVFAVLIASPLQRLVYSSLLLDRVVATVNGEVITWSELREKIENEGGEILKGLTDKEREKKVEALEPTFLNKIIDLKLQLQEARRLRLGVSASETETAIDDIRRKYELTDEGLAESLKAEGLTLEQYRKQLAEQILLSKVVKNRVNDSILITDKEIEEYYNANREKYLTEEEFRIRQIFLNGVSRKAEIEARAKRIVQMIDNGEDFSKLAREFSEDPTSKFGGDLGFVSHGSVLKEIRDVVLTLQVGEVSRPFWSSAGMHIVKLEDVRKGIKVEEIRDEIKKILFEEAFILRYEDWIKSLREKAYIEINL